MKDTFSSIISNLGIVVCKDDFLVPCTKLFTGNTCQLLSRVVPYLRGLWPSEKSQRGSRSTKTQENSGHFIHSLT